MYVHKKDHKRKVANHSVDLIHGKCKVCCLEASCAEALQNLAIVNTSIKVISFHLHRCHRQLSTCYKHCFLSNAGSFAARHHQMSLHRYVLQQSSEAMKILIPATEQY